MVKQWQILSMKWPRNYAASSWEYENANYHCQQWSPGFSWQKQSSQEDMLDPNCYNLLFLFPLCSDITLISSQHHHSTLTSWWCHPLFCAPLWLHYDIIPPMYLVGIWGCGEHCCSWEFLLLGLDRCFQFVLVFFTHFQGAVLHWPNGIHCCSESGTGVHQKIQHTFTI